MLKMAVCSLTAFMLIFHALLANNFVQAAAGEEDPSYMSVCVEATSMPALELLLYDYIIVGGGTAGCPLAATLSQNFSVLILERGGLGHTLPVARRERGFVFNVLNTTPNDDPAESFKSEDGVDNERGIVLGGSSTISAGFYSRAESAYIRDSGWDEALVNQSYKWVENSVVFRPALRQWKTAFRGGLLKAGSYPDNGYTLDHVEGTKIGGTTFDRSGVRHSSANLLDHANLKNLKIVTRAKVFKVFFGISDKEQAGGQAMSKPKAYAVEYVDSAGTHHLVLLKPSDGGEVIISSGALGSPQLLLLSGIGPREHLESLGIPVVMDLAGVGQGMGDNPKVGIAFISSRQLEYALPRSVVITPGSCIESASIPTHNPFIYDTRHKPFLYDTDDDSNGDPDPEIAYPYAYLNVASIFEIVAGPLSKGELHLRSRDFNDTPSVQFNYFSHPQDLENCVNGLRTIKRIKETIRNSFFIGTLFPANTSDNEAMEAFCRMTFSTSWHYHGGCQVGSVVNDKYQVQGIDSLRVIDGSTFSRSPGSNPQATVMMLGRYMGLQILKERLAKS